MKIKRFLLSATFSLLAFSAVAQSISGPIVTIPVPISQGGTGATTAAAARTNLGLGTMATQNANAVAITGGTAALSPNFTVGDSTVVAGQTLLDAQFSTDTAGGVNLILRKSNAGTNNPSVLFAKSRGTAASPVIITSGDSIGGVIFTGFDGTNYTRGAQILASSEGTIAGNQVPGNIEIYTSSATGVNIRAFKIDSSQILYLGASTGNQVTVTGGTAPKVSSTAGNLTLTSASGGTTTFSGTSGTSPFDVISSGQFNGPNFHGYAGSAASPFHAINIYGARGTDASPSALASGDTIAYFNVLGYGASSAFVNSVASIAFVTPAAPSGSVVQGQIEFYTQNSGGTNTRAMFIDSTQVLNMGAGGLAANGSVATALSSVGPVGSHTTVQEWLLVKGTGGASRWIPMF